MENGQQPKRGGGTLDDGIQGGRRIPTQPRLRKRH